MLLSAFTGLSGEVSMFPEDVLTSPLLLRFPREGDHSFRVIYLHDYLKEFAVGGVVLTPRLRVVPRRPLRPAALHQEVEQLAAVGPRQEPAGASLQEGGFA